MGDSVFVNGRAVVHKGSGGQSIAAPDVCLCPPGPPAGPVPVPLVNTVVAADMDGGTQTVLVEGNPQGTRNSFFEESTGNEVAQATGGGVMTGVVQGQAKFGFGYSRNVIVEGEPAVRHLNPLTHNHAGPVANTPPAPWISTMSSDVPRIPPKAVIIDAAESTETIDIRLVDENDLPLDPTPYRLTTPSGKTFEGRVLAAATLRVIGLTKGNCRLVLPGRTNDVARRGGPQHQPLKERRSGTSQVLLSPWRSGRRTRSWFPGCSVSGSTCRSTRATSRPETIASFSVATTALTR